MDDLLELVSVLNFHFVMWVDRVPNIKFNVAKMLQSMIPIVDSTVRSHPLITLLTLHRHMQLTFVVGWMHELALNL